MTDDKFTRQVEFVAAFDKTDETPSKGIHGVEMHANLIGPAGAINFVVYTNWHLPETQKRIDAKPPEPRFPYLFHKPQPATVAFHHPKPQWEGQDETACNLLPGGKCYGDITFTGAAKIFDALVEGGSAGMWAALEEWYVQEFEEETNDG